jgi:hypothetical protein
MISAKDTARRFGRSTRFVNLLAKQGVLHRLVLPPRKRACGYYTEG